MAARELVANGRNAPDGKDKLMRKKISAAAAAALALGACGQQQSSETNAPAAQSQTYGGTGKVTAIAADQVTIAHGPIQGIGWPAMTMTFTAPQGLANGIQAGDAVDFSFRRQGSGYQLTSLRKR